MSTTITGVVTNGVVVPSSPLPEGANVDLNSSTGTTLLDPSAEHWLLERIQFASRELGDCIEFNPAKCGGIPVVKGTRISVAQILAEIGEGQSVDAVAEDFDMDALLIKRLVKGLAMYLDRPVRR